jgi:hypothetical protein
MNDSRIPGVELTQRKGHVLVLDGFASVTILHQVVLGTRLCQTTLSRRSSTAIGEGASWSSRATCWRSSCSWSRNTIAPSRNQDTIVRQQ